MDLLPLIPAAAVALCSRLESHPELTFAMIACFHNYKIQGVGLGMVDKLLRLIKVLTTLPDIEDAIDCFLQELASHYQADRAYIIEYDFTRNILNNTYEWCAPGVPSEMELLQNVELSVVDEWNQRFEENGDFYISALHQQLDKNSRDYQLLEMQGITSLMAAPLIRQGRVIGFLGVDNPMAQILSTELLRATVDFLSVELEKRRMIQLMETMASTDSLTGVKNRSSYINMLRKIEYNPPKTIGFMYADINGLNRMNEIFGYDIGDDALRKTAKILREYAGEHVYRIGGDEFAAILPETDREVFEEISRQIRSAYAQIPEYQVAVGSSFVECNGFINLQQQYSQVHELMNADKMQYYIDTRYEMGLHKRGDQILQLLKEIEEGRFRMYLQPQIDLDTGLVCGAEALVRKFDDEGRMIPPVQFVHKYEVLGLQVHLDRFALETVIRMLAGIPAEKRRGGVSVNISRSMVEMPGFSRDVELLLKKYGLEAHYLTLEITEGVAKMGVNLLETVVRDLRNIGVKVALDDFGTEYANLSVLINIDFDEVKLDKSLIDNLCTDRKAQSVVKNVVNMCKEVGSGRIIAEGVETSEQRRIIQELNCSHGQGYLFYRPMPMQEYLEILETMGTTAS